eukprot:5576434-Amphidinium_carterae.1
MLKSFGSSGTVLPLVPWRLGPKVVVGSLLKAKLEAFRQRYEAGLLHMARTGQAVLAHAWP